MWDVTGWSAIRKFGQPSRSRLEISALPVIRHCRSRDGRFQAYWDSDSHNCRALGPKQWAIISFLLHDKRPSSASITRSRTSLSPSEISFSSRVAN
jgi:hypothetical protein